MLRLVYIFIVQLHTVVGLAAAVFPWPAIMRSSILSVLAADQPGFVFESAARTENPLVREIGLSVDLDSGVFDSVFFMTAQPALSAPEDGAPGPATLPIRTVGVKAGYFTNTAALSSDTGMACVMDEPRRGSAIPTQFEISTYTIVDGTHLRLTLGKPHASGATIIIGSACSQTASNHPMPSP